ncbi:uncharacterized protein RJT20DRAFT_145858 [Scheffersomyces xylosifermentans]|uniref:uncharacterized protein n=1 Tax=Scheffersomyces xylosifermentans TaxID=1304137 RepID=UPI00315DFFC8
MKNDIHTSLSEDDSNKPKLKKRKYSRGGCNECKRRKMKCDESKPECYNCARLKKVCVYEQKQKFRFENMKPTRHDVEQEAKSSSPIQNSLEQNSPQTPSVSSAPASPSYKKAPFRNCISDILTPTDDGVQTPPVINQQDLLVMQNLFQEASLLVNDMNGFVSLDFGESNPTPLGTIKRPANSISSEGSTKSESYERHHFKLEDFTNNLVEYRSPTEPASPFPIQEFFVKDDMNLSASISELVNETLQHYKLSGPHITYLNSLTNTALSYHIFPFASSIESNEVIKILLKYSNGCAYLLTSLLAISATFQYNQTGKPVHDISRQKYVKICLKSLGEAFVSSDKLPNKLANDIERLLLTVLILTSNFTSTTYAQSDNLLDSWKTHLRGAKDLLTKYSAISKAQNKSYMSGGLALAKTWFFAIETMANLNSSLGGTLSTTKKNKSKSNNDNEADEEKDDVRAGNIQLFLDTGYFDRETNPVYHDALVRIGLLTPLYRNSTQINLYVGYSIKVVYLFQEFIRLIEDLKDSNGAQLSPEKVSKIMSLLYAAQQTEIAPKVSKTTFVIPEGSPAHPDYPKDSYDVVTLPPSAYEKHVSSSNEVTYYSWYDLSEQLHVDVVYLRLLCTKGLLKVPKSHPLVKSIVARILNAAFFIKSKDSEDYAKDADDILTETEHFYLSKKVFDNRVIMIQSPFKICSKLVEDDRDFEKIEIFFQGLVKLGNGSSLSSLDVLFKFRNRAPKMRINQISNLENLD